MFKIPELSFNRNNKVNADTPMLPPATAGGGAIRDNKQAPPTLTCHSARDRFDTHAHIHSHSIYCIHTHTHTYTHKVPFVSLLTPPSNIHVSVAAEPN